MNGYAAAMLRLAGAKQLATRLHGQHRVIADWQGNGAVRQAFDECSTVFLRAHPEPNPPCGATAALPFYLREGWDTVFPMAP